MWLLCVQINKNTVFLWCNKSLSGQLGFTLSFTQVTHAVARVPPSGHLAGWLEWPGVIKISVYSRAGKNYLSIKKKKTKKKRVGRTSKGHLSHCPTLQEGSKITIINIWESIFSLLKRLHAITWYARKIIGINYQMGENIFNSYT